MNEVCSLVYDIRNKKLDMRPSTNTGLLTNNIVQLKNYRQNIARRLSLSIDAQNGCAVFTVSESEPEGLADTSPLENLRYINR